MSQREALLAPDSTKFTWNGPRKFDVFVSYASEEWTLVVEPLCRSLLEERVNVWFDKSRLEPGEAIEGSLRDGIARSTMGIVVLSRAYLSPDRPWLAMELDALLEQGTTDKRGKQRLFPILVGITHTELEEAVEALSPGPLGENLQHLATLKCLELSGAPSAVAQQLVSLWRHLLLPMWGPVAAAGLALVGAALVASWWLLLASGELPPRTVTISGVLTLLLATWCWGLTHLAMVPPAEPGNLDPARYGRRLALYFSSGVGSVLVYAELFGEPLLAATSSMPASLLVNIAAMLVMSTTLLVSGLSYLEAHWYRVLPERRGMLRAATFRWLALPMIYGTISFHWVYIVAMLTLGAWRA